MQKETKEDDITIRVNLNKGRMKTFLTLLLGSGAIWFFSSSTKVHIVCIAIIVVAILGCIGSTIGIEHAEEKVEEKPKEEKKQKNMRRVGTPAEEKPVVEVPKDIPNNVTVEKEIPINEPPKQEETLEKHEMTNQEWEDFFASLENGGDD